MKNFAFVGPWMLGALQLLMPAPAQTPAAPAAAGQPPAAPPTVLKVTTRLVQVNVVVHARRSEPVSDLTKDDFVVYDNGQPQQIATFTMESVQPADAGARRAKLTLPLNTYTNRTDVRPAAPKAVTVLLLDGLNTRFEDQAYAKKQLVAFLQQLHPDDRVALYALSTRLQVLHDFTSDAAALIDAAKGHKNHIATELADSNPDEPDTGNDDLDEFLSQAQQRIADFQTVNRVNTTLAAIEAIANHVSRLPGRKNLIWISGGFPFHIGMDEMAIGDTRDRRMFTDEMERTAKSVNAANLAIYPVDARGLIAQPDFAASASGSKNARRPPTGQPSRAMKGIQETHDTMEILAERTGGKAYYNTNDLKNAIRGAIDDAQVSYVLGYYPTHNNWDGKYRNLKVEVKRKGANVRYRLGYFAFADKPQSQQDRITALREAAWSALDATQLGMFVRVARDIPQPGKLRVVLSLDVRNLELTRKDDRWAGTLDLLFVQQPSAGQPAIVTNDSISLNLTKDSYTQAIKTGLRFARDLELANAGYFLRVAVRDASSGNVGSVNIRTDKVKPEPPAAPKAAAPPEKK
jgi:VWFA-related protein